MIKAATWVILHQKLRRQASRMKNYEDYHKNTIPEKSQVENTGE